MKMKKVLTIMFVAASWSVCAQSGNTIWLRDSTYWYQYWYDECEAYTQDVGWIIGEVPGVFSSAVVPSGKDYLLEERVVTEHPVLAEGVAVMVAPSVPFSIGSLGSQYDTEYVLICHTDSRGRPVDTLASARWDTAAPRNMLLPQNRRIEVAGDTTYAVRMQVYEVRFDHPLLLDGDFSIIGTYNSNQRVQVNGSWYFKYKQTAYHVVQGYTLCNDCYSGIPLMYFDPVRDTFYRYGIERCHGPFLPIAGKVELTVLSADTLLGSVTGGGTYRSSETAMVGATPAPYCRFVGWSDGATDNPRAMQLWQDSTIVAQFVNDSSCYVRVKVNNPDWGSASGTGIYQWGQSVAIAAEPLAGYCFLEWADGIRDNPRTVLPTTADTVFTAIFDPLQTGIQDALDNDRVTIRPNPTQGILNIVCPEDSYMLTIHDGVGRMLRSMVICGGDTSVDIGDLPSGIYTVSIRFGDSKVAKTIIKL